MRAVYRAPARGATATRIVLLTGLLVPALAHAQVREVDPAAVDSAATDPATIDTVIIGRQDLFSDEAAAGSPFLRLFNDLHVTTRSYVVRRELLLRAGAPFDSLLAQESERNLRRLGLFRSVRVDTGRVDGQLALQVRTRDAWSLQPRAVARIASDGTLTGTVGITETNLAGTGNRLRAWYVRDADRDGVNLQLAANRLGPSGLAARVSWLNLSDRDVVSWLVARPFRSLSDRWSMSYDGRSFLGRILQFRRESPIELETTEFHRRFLVNRAFFSYAPIANAREYLRIGTSFEVRREEYLEIDPAAPDADSVFAAVPDTVYGLVGGFMEYRKARFARVERFNGFADEDQDLSDLVFVSAKLAAKGLGYESTGIGARVLVASGAQIGRTIIKGRVDANGLFNAAGLDSGLVVATGTVAVREGERNATFLQMSAGLQDSPAPGREFDIGFEVLPRLWGPHAFVGSRTFRATLEHRFFAVDNILNIIGLGFSGFVDYGGAWYPGQDPRFGGDTGIAIFIGSPLSSFAQVSNISVGYRFGGGLGETDESRLVISLGASIIF